MIDIDTLTIGRQVRLRFCGSDELGNLPYTAPAVFCGIVGSEDGRRARFESKDENGRRFEWEAYRFDDDWAYGTSAEPLKAISEEKS